MVVASVNAKFNEKEQIIKLDYYASLNMYGPNSIEIE